MTPAPATNPSGIPETIRRIIDHFDGPQARILEVGSSAGLHTRDLRGRVTVVDLDADKLAASGRYGNVEALVSHDLSARPLPLTGPFDLILCLEVLEHLEWDDATALLTQLENLCGGALVVSTPHVTNLTQLIRFALTRQLDLRQAHAPIERLLYRLRHGTWYDPAAAAAGKPASESEHADLDRHKCFVPTRYFRSRGYRLGGGVSVFLLRYPLVRRLRPLVGLALRAFPFLSGTTWAVRTGRTG